LGSEQTADNLIVLCSVCHYWTGTLGIPLEVLFEVREDWLIRGILGREKVVAHIVENADYLRRDGKFSLGGLLKWILALRTDKTFDEEFAKAREDILAAKNEDEFINHFLLPIFAFLTFEGIKVLHHRGGISEHGRDMVFYQRDKLDTFIYYAVVACNVKIHANSSKTNDPGHYGKIKDQVIKCYSEPWEDTNQKRQFYIDRVIIANPHTISNDAEIYLRTWEKDNRRHLIFLDGDSLARHLVNLRLAKSTTIRQSVHPPKLSERQIDEISEIERNICTLNEWLASYNFSSLDQNEVRSLFKQTNTMGMSLKRYGQKILSEFYDFMNAAGILLDQGGRMRFDTLEENMSAVSRLDASCNKLIEEFKQLREE
jgi:hypothetical protein